MCWMLMGSAQGAPLESLRLFFTPEQRMAREALFADTPQSESPPERTRLGWLVSESGSSILEADLRSEHSDRRVRIKRSP